jgi:hypothetical protein
MSCQAGGHGRHGADAFDYLTELERHAKDVAANPRDWMPWSYCRTLAAAASAVAL